VLKKVFSSPYTPAGFFIMGCIPTIYQDMFVSDSQYSGYIGFVFVILVILVIVLCGLSWLFKNAWVKILPFLLFVFLTVGLFSFSISPHEMHRISWAFILLCNISIWAAVAFAMAIPWRGKKQ
jgi:hypothetical protein